MTEKMFIPFPQELLAVREGIKPVMRKSFFERKIFVKKRIESICKEFKLQFLFKNVRNVMLVYISKDRKVAERAYYAEILKNYKKFGKILGYPECCVDFYMNIKNLIARGLTQKDKNFSFKYSTLEKTKTKPIFYLNNIYNFQGQALNRFITSKYMKLLSINKKIRKLYIIPHTPCSYDCKDSMKMAREIIRIMRIEVPIFTDEVISALKRPFLFFDDFNWIAFEGFVKGNEIIYDHVSPYRSLYPQVKFKKGNRLKVMKKEIYVFKDGELIHKIRRKTKQDGIIIDFS